MNLNFNCLFDAKIIMLNYVNQHKKLEMEMSAKQFQIIENAV